MNTVTTIYQLIRRDNGAIVSESTTPERAEMLKLSLATFYGWQCDVVILRANS